MTEQEYIDVSNLTKLRQSFRILADCLFMGDLDKAKQQMASRKINELIGKLEKKIEQHRDREQE